MNLIESVKYYHKNPVRLFFRVGKGFLHLLNDKQYVKLLFRSNFGYSLNLDNPQSYNEKLNWLKVYDHNPLYTTMVDKYAVKNYVANIIGDKYIIPALGVWDRFEDIDFKNLPQQFVLKCTHDSGGQIIVKDKDKLDIENARNTINKFLKRNYFLIAREWPYKNVRRRIIAEKYMEDSVTHDLRDYKFFVFDGVVKAMYIATERGSGEEVKFDFYDAEFNHLPFTQGHPNADVMPSKPSRFEEMKEIAARLSKGFPQLRVDFYEVNGQVYFGEFTIFHLGGNVPFEPREWDYKFGEWVSLPLDASEKS